MAPGGALAIGTADSRARAAAPLAACRTSCAPAVVEAGSPTRAGTWWLLGGYPGIGAAARQPLPRLDPAQLRQAWLLSSQTNPRRIGDWQQLLAQRLAGESHELAATLTMRAPYRWSKTSPDTIDVQIWRPLPKTRHGD